MTTIKLCGARSPRDVRVAARLGADFVGIVLARRSSRRVDVDDARRIATAAGGVVRTVGVFAGEGVEEILALRRSTGVDFVQVHGPLAPADLDRLVSESDGRVVRAYSAGEPFDADVDRGVFARLFDAPRPGGGEPWEWASVAAAPGNLPRWVAGGLTPSNVALAIAAARPDGVDVASGIEGPAGGWDDALAESFVSAARRAFSPSRPEAAK